MTKGRINKDDLLKPEMMIRLYSRGLFPMADKDGSVDWYMPEIRTIIPLDDFKIPRSLRKFMEASDFEYRFDFNVMKIVKLCARRKKTWISRELIDAYKGLHKQGNLHSVEVFQNNKLLAGLYGVTYRGAFFGESMFTTVSQGSKCALAALLKHLDEKGYALLDIQFLTPHLKMFGAREIHLEEYEKILALAWDKTINFI